MSLKWEQKIEQDLENHIIYEILQKIELWKTEAS